MWILKLDNLCGTEGVSFLSNVLGDLFVFDHIEEASFAQLLEKKNISCYV